MKKLLLTLPALAAFIAGPLAAQEVMACNPEVMDLVIAQVEDSAADAKTEAMAELQMAKDKMAEGDADTCSQHLTNASKLATGA